LGGRERVKCRSVSGKATDKEGHIIGVFLLSTYSHEFATILLSKTFLLAFLYQVSMVAPHVNLDENISLLEATRARPSED
jgi:hypothetical protein